MNNNRAWLRAGDEHLRQQILCEVLPEDCRQAYRQGLLDIHGLSRYFDREIAFVDLTGVTAEEMSMLRPLEFYGQVARAAHFARHVCLPHFDQDFALAFGQLEVAEMREIIRSLFAKLEMFHPEVSFHINVGAAMSHDAEQVVSCLLDLLDEGATRTNPFVIYRIREHVNMREGDPGFELSTRALQLARHRQGLAFSFMDSALNKQWVEMVSYTGDGVRIEPLAGDLFRGVRGMFVNSIVTISLPQLYSGDWQDLNRVVRLAGRILAQRLELFTQVEPGSQTFGTNVINLAGLNSCFADDPVGSFALLDRLGFLLPSLSNDFGLPFTLAATDSLAADLGLPARRIGMALQAEQQHKLPGGHSLVCPSGGYLPWQDLHSTLLAADKSGLSFLRFAPEDVRCGSCHLVVAATGPCPGCGNEERRRVDFMEGRLQAHSTGGAL